MELAFAGVLGLTMAAVLLGWTYFRRYRIARPPLGVMDRGDVLFVLVAVVIVPFLYLSLPTLVVGGLLAVGTLSAIGTALEPVVRAGLAWALALALVLADIGLAWRAGTTSRAFLAVNDGILLLLVVGVTNLWAQGGLRARDLALLAGALTLYDAMATAWLPLTTDLVTRLAGMPFLPMVAWPIAGEQWLGIGLGDLLLASVGPLVLRKAYGRTAGYVAIGIAVAAVAVVLAVAAWDLVAGILPTMVVLGPLLVAQYAYWQRRRGAERTTDQYLHDEPMPTPLRS